MTTPVTPHDALIFVMVMASAVDNSMNDKELRRIGQLIDLLPIFDGFDKDSVVEVSKRCADILAGPEGLDIALEVIRDAVPARSYDTAYALGLDKLTCAAIEHSAMARYRPM
jgi:hypothetical protein